MSDKLHSGGVGGYQSGKSTMGTVKCISKLLHHPNVPIAYYLPTYGLFEDMLIPKLEKFFDELNIDWDHNKKDSRVKSEIGDIWMRSMDNPDRIVSYSVGYSLVDEVDVVHPNKRKAAMKRISSRNSYKWGGKNCIDFVSTPEGFAYMYDFFIKKANNNKVLYRLSTLDNEDNLGDGYIDGLREQYTEQQLKAYLNGEFVNLTAGTVHHTFDRKHNHSDREIKKGEVLHVGMDFNITNMSATVRVTDGQKNTAVSEITGAYDTADMIRIIKERFKGHRIVVYPDASGNNRKTSASDTDIDLLKKARFTVRVGKKNPSVRDRITSVNTGFKNSKGETFNYINTNNCPELTEAYEKLAYKNGAPDKDSGFDHITEADGYCYYQMKGVKSFSRMRAS